MKQEIGLCTRYTAKGASSRLRFLAYRPALEKAGFTVRCDAFYPPEYLEELYRTGRKNPRFWAEAIFRRLLRVKNLPENLYIEYELLPYLPYWAERRILQNRRYVLGFDDDVFLRYGREPNKLHRLAAGAAGVICANDLLTEKIAPYQKNLLKVPTAPDLAKYRRAAEEFLHPVPEKLLGVWMGTPVTYSYLRQAAPCLRAMQKARPFKLRIVAEKSLTPIEGLEMECLDWSPDTEERLLAEADFGIMPLPADDAFARGKSAYKIIQYLSAGLPVIASPVGENCRVVTPECGFLAETPDEWAQALLRVDDPALKAGAAKRAEEFDLAFWAPKAAEFLRKAFSGI